MPLYVEMSFPNFGVKKITNKSQVQTYNNLYCSKTTIASETRDFPLLYSHIATKVKIVRLSRHIKPWIISNR